VYLSVGTCSLRPTSQALLRPALKLAAYRSFRDEGSRTLTSFAEFTRRDPVMPDLAFSLDALASPATTTRQRSAQRIGVSPIAYLSRIWPESDTTVYSAYVNCLVRFIADMTRRGHSVAVFTSDPVDWSAVRDIESAWKDLPDASPPGQVEFLRTFTLQDFLAQVSSLDIFIASRLHGVLLAHLQSTPTVAVSYDRKVDVYMRDADQEAYRIDIRTLSLPDLEERVDRLSARAPEVRERLRSMRLTNRARLAEQYDHVFNTLL
jgi:polysaccharide pyruvyl transferase WcaK-like protein